MFFIIIMTRPLHSLHKPYREREKKENLKIILSRPKGRHEALAQGVSTTRAARRQGVHLLHDNRVIDRISPMQHRSGNQSATDTTIKMLAGHKKQRHPEWQWRQLPARVLRRGESGGSGGGIPFLSLALTPPQFYMSLMVKALWCFGFLYFHHKRRGEAGEARLAGPCLCLRCTSQGRR